MKAPGLSKLPWYDAAAAMWREQYTSELALEELTDVLQEVRVIYIFINTLF
jgi:hypothetical protein